MSPHFRIVPSPEGPQLQPAGPHEPTLQPDERRAVTALNRALISGGAKVTPEVDTLLKQTHTVPVPPNWPHKLHPVLYQCHFPKGRYAALAMETIREMIATAQALEEMRLEEEAHLREEGGEQELEVADEDELEAAAEGADAEGELDEDEEEEEASLEEQMKEALASDAGPVVEEVAVEEAHACPDPDCEFVAGSGSGLASHVRSKHPELVNDGDDGEE